MYLQIPFVIETKCVHGSSIDQDSTTQELIVQKRETKLNRREREASGKGTYRWAKLAQTGFQPEHKVISNTCTRVTKNMFTDET